MSALPRRLATAVLAALAVLAVAPGAAPAKGLVGLTVCGAHRCVDRTGAVRSSTSVSEGLIEYSVTVADPGPMPFVRLHERLGDGGGESFGTTTVAYLPRVGALRFEDGTFHRVTPALRRSLRRLLRGVRPLPRRRRCPTATPRRRRA